MRRWPLPLILLVVAIAALVLSGRANNVADPGSATATSSDPSLATPILSVRRAPDWLRAPKADSLLAESIGRVLADAAGTRGLCVHVESDGIEIASNNAKAALASGDLHRLLTATVIDAVGSGGAFRTEVAIASDAVIVLNEQNGSAELRGDIYVIGGGDPTLATDDYVAHFGYPRAYTSFNQLAADTVAALQELNIVSVRGRIIGDESKYSPVERDYYRHKAVVGEATLSVWNQSDGRGNSVGPLSALMLNDGFVSWPQELDQSRNIRSSNPPLSVAADFDDLLEAAGLKVRYTPRAGVAPGLADRKTLAVADSAELTGIIARSLTDATTSEMLLKEYGVRSGGSSQRGDAIFVLVSSGFEAAGLPFTVTDSSTLYFDGSGRSASNATSCEMLHATISESSGIGAEVIPDRAASPVATCAGTDGDLRVMATASATGTGLAGHFTAPNGERLTFAMLANDPSGANSGDNLEQTGPYEFCNAIQAAMLDAIVGHPYGPELTALAPLEPRNG